MSKSEWKKLVGVVGRPLLAFVFVFSQAAWAGQNPQTKDKADSLQKAVAQQAGEKQSSAATTAKAQSKQARGEESESSVAEEKSSRDGRHEGIKVHGHWTIEVKNPDGTLVRHLEFENSLDPGFTVTNVPTSTGGPSTIVVPGGATYLSALFTGNLVNGNNNISTGNWQIWLIGQTGLNMDVSSPNSGPCARGSAGLGAGTVLNGNCVIWQTNNGNILVAPCLVDPAVSCNLSVKALGTPPAFTGIQLIGTMSVTSNSQISTVATILGNVAGIGNLLQMASLTSSTNFPGAPISVVAGQMVSVTVNISFS